MDRMKSAGWVPGAHTFTVEDDKGKEYHHPIAWEDAKGNLRCATMGVDGPNFVTDADYYDAPIDSKSEIQVHHNVRLAKVTDKGKMFTVGGGSHEFIPPHLAEKYHNGTEIKTLFITEGIWKAAVAGCVFQMDMIGIPGITNWGAKKSKEAYPDIIKIIEKCKVKNVVFLIDADAMEVVWKEGKDLYKRPNQFRRAIYMFRNRLSDVAHGPYLKFSYIKPDLKQKGIDDLLLSVKDNKAKSIIKDLQKITGESKFVNSEDVTEMRPTAMYRMFHIDGVESFYSQYSNVIGFKRFIYDHSEYEWDDDKGKVKMLRSKESASIKVISDKIVRTGWKRGDNGIAEQALVGTKRGMLPVIWECLPKEAERHLEGCEKFFGVVNLPSHTNYKYYDTVYGEDGSATKWFNIYRPVSHQPVKGKCPLSLNFIRHIFGTEIVDDSDPNNIVTEFDLGLDYMSILWNKPTQKLPILSLVSEDGATGKTTFCDWLKAIYQQNCRKITENDLQSDMTAFFAACNVVYGEEMLVKDEKVINAIKSKQSDKKIRYREMYMPNQEIDLHATIILLSNHVKNFVKIDPKENRFWVREIPIITEYIEDFTDKLFAEIPKFLEYIQNRPMKTRSRDRNWFHPDLIKTEAGETIKKTSQWAEEKIVRSWVRDHFLAIEKPTFWTTAAILSTLMEEEKEKIKPSYIKKILEERLKMKRRTNQNFEIVHKPKIDEDIDRTFIQKKKSEPFVFFVCDFFPAHDYLDWINKKDDLLYLEKHLIKEGRKSFFNDLSLELALNMPYVKKMVEIESEDKVKDPIIKLLNEKDHPFKKLCDVFQEMIDDFDKPPF